MMFLLWNVEVIYYWGTIRKGGHRIKDSQQPTRTLTMVEAYQTRSLPEVVGSRRSSARRLVVGGSHRVLPASAFYFPRSTSELWTGPKGNLEASSIL